MGGGACVASTLAGQVSCPKHFGFDSMTMSGRLGKKRVDCPSSNPTLGVDIAAARQSSLPREAVLTSGGGGGLVDWGGQSVLS